MTMTSPATDPTQPRLSYEHKPQSTVIRHRFVIDNPGTVPAFTAACSNASEPGNEFEVDTVIIECAAKDSQILAVILWGKEIITTGTGRMVTTHPRSHTYTDNTGWPDGGLAALPVWVRPILEDAARRTREAFA